MTANRTIIRNIMTETGCPLHGVCPFSPFADRLLPCRAVRRLPQDSVSIIIAAFPYRPADAPDRNLSYYACVPDYHHTAGSLLKIAADRLAAQFPSHRFEPFLDNSPIPEVSAAVQAGLGVRGRNGLLIHPVYGSWVFLGEIVTDLVVEYDRPLGRSCCECGACVRLCPGGALKGGTLDQTKCLSAISQKKGNLSEDEQALLRQNGLVWGCDKCQEVCPHNRRAAPAPDSPVTAGFLPRITAPEDGTDDVPRAWEWRGCSVMERNLKLFDE
ncbi:MAG: DUF1730 domain-containing protein [Clostridiales bacterium]|nr:DUF1730 domain-containing protein [Clostridiales bacterium]